MGVAQRVVNGVVVETKVVNQRAPSLDLEQLLESGAADSEGFTYNEAEGAYSDDGVTEVRLKYIERVPYDHVDSQELEQPLIGANSAPELHSPKIDEALSELLSEGNTDKLVNVYIRLRATFSTSLRGTSGVGHAASLADAERAVAKRQQLLGARKAEAAVLQGPLLDALRVLGAVEAAGAWLGVPGVMATVPLGVLPQLLQRADVVRIELERQVKPTAFAWDGADMKSSAGLNLGTYVDSGYHGEQFNNTPGGRFIRVGIVDSVSFNVDHRGFLDSPSAPTRIQAIYECTSNSCSTSGINAPTSHHGTKMAGIAAGSITQGQIEDFTATEELERTGIAEEAHIFLFDVTSDGGIREAINKAVELEVDILSISLGPGTLSDPCDGEMSGDIGYAAYDAQLAGTVVIKSAGNDGEDFCTFDGLSESPSVFVVGAATDGNASTWSTRDIASYSERGGADAVINGVLRPEALSLVSAIAPGCVAYAYSAFDNYEIVASAQCNTSSAAPQVAGAGVVVKDWFLTNGYTTILTEGRLLAVLLAMTDRANSVSTKASTAFHPKWGGGRFQARKFGSELGSPWGWETWSGVVSHGQVSDHNLLGSGAEPSGIGQFKVYGLFFEDNYEGMANLNLRIMTSNCAGSELAGDFGYDTKIMARVGSTASGHQLCIRRSGASVPSGETRRLHHVAYYSGPTSMR